MSREEETRERLREQLSKIGESYLFTDLAPGTLQQFHDHLAELLVGYWSKPESFWVRHPRLADVVHNCLAHPLLVLCPPVGERLHSATAAGYESPLTDTVLANFLAETDDSGCPGFGGAVPSMSFVSGHKRGRR